MKTEIAKQLNDSVATVLSASQVMGFEKAFMIATAIAELEKALTPEYMKPILSLQGNRLGFKTDRDNAKTGDKFYSAEIVKRCLIEAVLLGVQPFGNQFNIIAGNTYLTKEGLGHLLANMEGLSYRLKPELPRIGEKSAAVRVKVSWTYKGVSHEEDLDFPIKVNDFMGPDAVLGKATRKARAWLYTTLTGSEAPEGEVIDVEGKVVSSTIKEQSTPELDRLLLMIQDAKTKDDLEKLRPHLIPDAEQAFTDKLNSF